MMLGKLGKKGTQVAKELKGDITKVSIDNAKQRAEEISEKR